VSISRQYRPANGARIGSVAHTVETMDALLCNCKPQVKGSSPFVGSTFFGASAPHNAPAPWHERVHVMLSRYIQAAMRQAAYEILEDGSFYGSIPGFPGLWANEPTLEACREELQSALEAHTFRSLT